MRDYRKKDGFCEDSFQQLHLKEKEPEGQRREGWPEGTKSQNCFSLLARPPASGGAKARWVVNGAECLEPPKPSWA